MKEPSLDKYKYFHCNNHRSEGLSFSVCTSAPCSLHSPVRSFRGCHGYLCRRKLRSTLPPPSFIKIHVIDWLDWNLQTPLQSPYLFYWVTRVSAGQSWRTIVLACCHSRTATNHGKQTIPGAPASTCGLGKTASCCLDCCMDVARRCYLVGERRESHFHCVFAKDLFI